MLQNRETAPELETAVQRRRHPFTRSPLGLVGLAFLTLMLAACFGSLPWLLAPRPIEGSEVLPPDQQRRAPAYDAQNRDARHLPPAWVRTPLPPEGVEIDTLPDSPSKRLAKAAERAALVQMAVQERVPLTVIESRHLTLTRDQLAAAVPVHILGTDVLGRDLLARCLVGGAVSLGIGIAAAGLSVFLGTLYGAVAGFVGGRVDAIMMRVVDVLYGLPYVLLVVLLAVASDAVIGEFISRNHARQHWVSRQAALVAAERGLPADAASVRALLTKDPVLEKELVAKAEQQPALRRREVSQEWRTFYDLATLLVAIGGVSWLTMARVIRGQVLSLKAQPFIEAARAIGMSRRRIFLRHLLPNLTGPIIVYATLTVPQAILQESFLSFLGIGVKPPLPSWGNLASEGLGELNVVQSQWWLLVFPSLLLGCTLLALNFVGEGLREALDPRRHVR